MEPTEHPNASGTAEGVEGQGAGESSPSVRIEALSKTFTGQKALDELTLDVIAGEIHVLVGQNGSGKSTFIKILSGYHLPDPGGKVTIGSEQLRFGAPEDAYRLGCRFVHQDLGLLPSRSVLDNFSLGAGFPTRFGTIRSKAALAGARQALDRVGLHLADLNADVAELSASQRTGLAMARALREDPGNPVHLLVLDEPTATLPLDEVEHLLGLLKNIARSGVAIIYVTHHLDEVFDIGDRITVLRDGQQLITTDINAVDHDSLVHLLVGEELEAVKRDQSSPGRPHDQTPALSVRNLTVGPIVDVSFDAHAGDVIGIAGLAGSGRETILGAIFGATGRSGGAVSVRGTRLRPGRPDLSISAGMSFMPADRKSLGGLMSLTARENITLANLRPIWTGLRLARKREADECRSWFARLRVQPAGAWERELSGFSGGNQQKILLAKWLRLNLPVLLVDEPSQGVDVGATAALHRVLLEIAADGAAVVVSSTDVDELTTICSEVIVLRNGKIIGRLTDGQVNSGEMTRLMMATNGQKAAGTT
jgi:ribose transport system ATP-binding protein